MNVKEYLGQAYRIDQRINAKLEQVSALRDLAHKASTTLSEAAGGGTRNVHSLEGIIAKIIDMETEINADIDMLVDLKAEIVAAIKAIANPEYQTLLELRYLCFHSWERIAIEMKYDLRYLYKLHGCALEQCAVYLHPKH